MEENLVIGIEGLVGSGKTSICKELVNYIPNSIIFTATNVYRAIAFKILEEKIDINTLKGVDIKEYFNKYNINIKIEGNRTYIYSGEEKLSEEDLQSRETSLAVSEISNIAYNKNAYVLIYNMIKELKKEYNVILSCRDTYRIFPELDYHFFIVASLEERIRRKCIQYKDSGIDIESIKNNIIKRDKLQKDSGYYDLFEKTIKIDVTECKSVKESTKKVLDFIKIPETI